ncbi:TPA: type II toxin-antitoxin system HicA family toxin [Pseudomonas aeruginosa]|nr:type II toxin-antitoxin system HicA family toxin [Pseudomonas aeruginosa]
MRNSVLRGCGAEVKGLVSFAEAAGWVVTQTKGLRLMFTKEGRRAVFFSSSSGDRRALLNAKSQLNQSERAAESILH